MSYQVTKPVSICSRFKLQWYDSGWLRCFLSWRLLIANNNKNLRVELLRTEQEQIKRMEVTYFAFFLFDESIFSLDRRDMDGGKESCMRRLISWFLFLLSLISLLSFFTLFLLTPLTPLSSPSSSLLSPLSVSSLHLPLL